jgi:hypothetical protein
MRPKSKLFKNGRFLYWTEELCDCVENYRLGQDRIEIYDYDQFTEELLQIIKLKPFYCYPIECLIDGMSYYNRSGVRFKPLDDKYEDLLIIGKMFLWIQGYVYETQYTWIHREKNQLKIDGPKGHVEFDYTKLTRPIQVEPRYEEKICDNCRSKKK